MFGSKSYRIPSLLTALNGTILAGIDQRIPGSEDSPNEIKIAIRRSLDGGETWEPIQVAASYPGTGPDAPSVIDSALLQDPATGTLFLIFDHFPGGYGYPQAQQGTGFAPDGHKLLFDADNHRFMLGPNGEVFDSSGALASYKVLPNGDVYNGETYSGNIYFKAGTLPESLHVLGTSYLQIIESQDDGLTWSEPRDLNFQVKADWMKFMGTGPGNGIVINEGPYIGRLVFPVYFTNSCGMQSSAVIYSDDHGVTWHRGESPNDGRNWGGKTLDSMTMDVWPAQLTEAAVVQLRNGVLQLYMRNTSDRKRVAVATSFDGGTTWENDVAFADALLEPYCQLTAITYPDPGDGKERVLFANPSNADSRVNGTVRLSEDGGKTWSYSRTIAPGSYWYSSLTVLPDKRIGLLYEGEGGNILFTAFNLEWIKS
ncbi:sialidase family protein [Paenibacillus aurantius]|uniref:exo-alpha-sialidase n=1 Tax=Paenibacillus aurantius TaxID=2918900 RepID=A0AA96RGI7_9BACL|nr:sialidase family protein [Paenibacillus aurantius]WNQ13077.1 sialidase family protein [Paenibacillus aurantius]